MLKLPPPKVFRLICDVPGLGRLAEQCGLPREASRGSQGAPTAADATAQFLPGGAALPGAGGGAARRPEQAAAGPQRLKGAKEQCAARDPLAPGEV